MKLKKFLSAILTAAIFACANFTITASAATTPSESKSSSNLNFSSTRQKQTWHFKTKAAAENKLRQLQRLGHVASMFKNIRGWSVTTLGIDKSRTTTTTTTSGGTMNGGGKGTVLIGAGCDAALRGAKVVYYPGSMKSMAQDMYNAHLRQGDCAKLWYDSSRGEWALAIKEMPGSGSRRSTIKKQ